VSAHLPELLALVAVGWLSVAWWREARGQDRHLAELERAFSRELDRWNHLTKGGR
jgi:hypothetical protein